MRIFLLFLGLMLCCTSNNLMAQTNITISGFISDQRSNEKIIGASIFIEELKIGTTTNSYGFYTITVPAGKYQVQYTQVGFLSQLVEIDATSASVNKDVQLRPQGKALGEVKATAKKKVPIQQSTQTSMNSIPISQIKSMPAIFGEVDVLKALQLLPGVSGGSEGSAGIYVRGGGPDQNLFLLDGVPVYNVNHLGGFFSTFNADAISNVDLYKGGFPARFGGRLSSVVDIRLKEGNQQKLNVEGGIGLISSRLMIEGPLKKNKGSFIISGRRTYIDQLAKPLIKIASNGLVNAGYYFYDLNAKLNYKVTPKDHIYLSGYFGRDKFYTYVTEKYNFGSSSYKNIIKANLNWGNATGVARWNHLFTNKIFGNLSVSYTSYDYQVLGSNEERTPTDSLLVSGKLFSGIKDVAARYDLEFTPNSRHNLKAGACFTAHTFTPSATTLKVKGAGSNIDTTLNKQNILAYETDVYAEDDFRVTDALKVNLGLHFSNFTVQNSSYNSLQPRLSARYLINSNYSIKASYAQMNQFINLLTFDGVGLPTDYWVPVTDRIKPQVSKQATLGVAGTYNKIFEVSVEGYYKSMLNIIDYKDGSSYFNIGKGTFEDIVEMGRGRCYGVEFLVQKKEGRIQGLAGYTLSWAERQYPTINFSRWYYYKYDRRHDIKTAVIYQLKDNIEASASWVYNTGNWTTLPTLSLNAQSPNQNDPLLNLVPIDYYPQRNNWNMKNYHRLDFSVKFSKQKSRFNRDWVIGCYNAYGRKNPFFMIRGNDNQGYPAFKNVALFGFPLPYVAYNFKIKTVRKNESN